jgi:DNA-binding transcriptional regulator LsrR (DeoR family)
MIPFAGKDPNENKRQFAKAVTAYELFQLGLDTMRIADRLGISEAQALKFVNQERSALIHKPSPYGV